jgi:hypothetical protein
VIEKEHKCLSNIIDPFTEVVLIRRTKEMVSRWASKAEKFPKLLNLRIDEEINIYVVDA